MAPPRIVAAEDLDPLALFHAYADVAGMPAAAKAAALDILQVHLYCLYKEQ